MIPKARPSCCAAAIGLLGVVALGTPASADGTGDGVIANVAGATFSTIMCAGVAQAEIFDEGSGEPHARRGFLLGASGIYGADTRESELESSLQNDAGVPLSFSLKNSFGFKGQAGFRCHPRISAEVDVEWLDGFDGTVFLSSLGETVSVDFEPVVVTTNMKGYLLTGRYQPFVLFGGGAMIVEVTAKDQSGLGIRDTRTQRGAVLRYGSGIDFYATEQIVLTLGVDYLQPFGDVEDLDYVSVGWGLRYRF